MNRLLCFVWNLVIVGILAACSSAPKPSPMEGASSSPAGPAAFAEEPAVLPPPIVQSKSRWMPVRWAELPGWGEDPPHEAWNAWLKSCERPNPQFVSLCGDVRRLSIGSAEEQRAWMMARLQPYRVESLQGSAEGLLTGYYEPVLEASRTARADYQVPLYRPPASLGQRKPWYTRQEIETQAEVQALLRGREIAYLADPLDALVLQIQGSGRLRITEPDGSQRVVRVAFAATNEQPYRSVGNWLLSQGAVRDASWAGIKAWAVQNPQRVNELMWANPRYVFFREDTCSPGSVGEWPCGAQGVPLTPGRSIAVERGSIPYGTPVWLASSGPFVNLQKLVLAQDTGSAIVGAVRADYFAGGGAAAMELAGRLKQPLRLWVLWPK